VCGGDDLTLDTVGAAGRPRRHRPGEFHDQGGSTGPSRTASPQPPRRPHRRTAHEDRRPGGCVAASAHRTAKRRQHEPAALIRDHLKPGQTQQPLQRGWLSTGAHGQSSAVLAAPAEQIMNPQPARHENGACLTASRGSRGHGSLRWSDPGRCPQGRLAPSSALERARRPCLPRAARAVHRARA
jgi:hypothetical protein